jgi:ribosomal protein S18 acetylase RimI-like enzyme
VRIEPAKFEPVSDDEDVMLLAKLAREIWTEHYEPIIGLDQVGYMLENLQSPLAIREQLDQQGFRYYFIRDDEDAVGYIGVQPEGDTLFLSKLYVSSEVRGRGFGRAATNYVFRLAKELGCRKVRLTVNKYNDIANAAYERLGFKRCGEVVTDIGGGYVMDDYIFEKRV